MPRVPQLSVRVLATLLLALPGTAQAQARYSIALAPQGLEAPARLHLESPTVWILPDSSKPLIRAPGWWPDRITHQNVAFLMIAGVAGFGIIWVLPEEISKWDKSVPMSEYLRRAYTMPPVWDRDEVYWNYVVHPITGMWVYLMERNHGRKPIRGFLLSTAASVGWEYGFEAFIERPSVQDLLFTSTIGSIFGELTYGLTKSMKEGGFTGIERVVLTVLNPVYVVQNGYR